MRGVSYADGQVKDFEQAAKILFRNPEIGNSLIAHRFSLEDSKEAFDVAQDKNFKCIKEVFDPKA